MVSLGDAGEMSPNASAMLRITTLSAWAQLHVASASQTYLENVIKPHKATLAPLWIAALCDYASIRLDSEFTQESPAGGIEASYSSLGKEVLMPVSVFSIKEHCNENIDSIMWMHGLSYCLR